jgi:hypothetical protein
VSFACVDFSPEEFSIPAAIAERTGAKSASSHNASSEFAFLAPAPGTPCQIT